MKRTLIMRTFSPQGTHMLGTGGMTGEERGKLVAYTAAGTLIVGSIYAATKGMLLLGGTLAISAVPVAAFFIYNARDKSKDQVQA